MALVKTKKSVAYVLNLILFRRTIGRLLIIKKAHMNTTAEVIAELKNMFAILLVRGRSDLFLYETALQLNIYNNVFLLNGKTG